MERNLLDVEPQWTDVVAAIGGGIGALTGIAALFVALRTSNRSAKAAESSALSGDKAAHAAERSADASDLAVRAAERSADSAVLSAKEASVLSQIEKRRFHRELGPSLVHVRFKWMPSISGGAVFAHITNAAPHDFQVECVLLMGSNSTQLLARRTLMAGNTEPVFVIDLPVASLGQMARQPDNWNEQAIELNQRTPKTLHQIREALRESPRQEFELLIKYQTAESCPCDVEPTSVEYGHWTMRHKIHDLDL